jgi:tetratricopeptide (TPR) repeat protein
LKGQIKQFVLVVCMTAGLGACGSLAGGHWFDDAFWASSPLKENTEAELGLAELAKGNHIVAQGHFQKALKGNPRDVQALLGQGILYHNTGQVTKAREMYEAVLAIRPTASEQMVVWNSIATRPISEIASVNLALLESGGVLTSMGQPPVGPPINGVQPSPSLPSGPAMNIPVVPPATGGTHGAVMLNRTIAKPTAGSPSAMAAASLMPKFADADANIVGRFKTIRVLRDQGLITPEEYATRRRANVGALLPLTSPPAAAGLDRPVPTTEQISGRLRAIGRALEMRAISVGQHAAERSMILDALMPAAPVRVANPGAPPQGLMEAADTVRRLEQLKEAAIITSDEYVKERRAVERAMQAKPMLSKKPTAPVASSSPGPHKTSAKTSAKPGGPKTAVHLASYRTRKAADRGWAQLRRAHKNVLGPLEPSIAKVNLGPGKGIYYRLKAGPLDGRTAASDICRKLKARQQYCELSYLENG